MQKNHQTNGALRSVIKKYQKSLAQVIGQLAQAVGNYPPEQVDIACFFQELIDGDWDAYEEATAHNSEELRKQDREILQMQEYVEKLDRSQNEEENTLWDKKIHYAIAKASRNVLIQNILNALSEVMDVFIEDMRREILRTEERKEMLQEFHKQMVEYLIKRDAKNGQKALMQHFEMIDQIIHEEMKI